jgi:hypothetical protein
MLFRWGDFTFWACLLGGCLAAGSLGYVTGRLVAFGDVVRALETGKLRQIIAVIRDLEE